MIRKRVSYLLLLGATAVFAACEHDTDGEPVTPTVVAGLRYVNLVPDTGGMDVRVVDIVGDAPNTFNATFRTGGAPYGVATTGLPLHTAVLAGTRSIRAFMSSSDITVATQQMLDFTYNFEANTNYTVYLYGYARSGSTPALQAVVVVDSQLTVAAGQVAVRLLNLAPTLAGNPAGSSATSVDARVSLVSAAISGAATFTGVGATGSTGYVSLPVTTAATGPYRLAALAPSTTGPNLFQALLPVGATGSSSTNPTPGTNVAGTVITAIIVPASVTGSAAPQGAPSAVTTNIDSVTRSTDTVTVWRTITAGSSTTCASAVAAGAAATDILHVSGLTQTEYNGAHAVVSVTAGTSQTRYTEYRITLSGGAAGSSYRLVFGTGATQVLTTLIDWDADSSLVREALANLSAVGGNANVQVSGAAGGPYTVRFKGSFAGQLLAATNLRDTLETGTLAAATARLAVACTGTATSSRFRFLISGTPTSPATGATSYRVVTAGNDYTSPFVLFAIDQLPARTAP